MNPIVIMDGFFSNTQKFRYLTNIIFTTANTVKIEEAMRMTRLSITS